MEALDVYRYLYNSREDLPNWLLESKHAKLKTERRSVSQFISCNKITMANLRRHFNFNTKSLPQESFSMPFCKTSLNNFDKLTFMNDICNSLDLCCSYVQTLNSLCNAGTLLARNLFCTVQEIPAYHNVSLQFLSVWEEVSKATAGASAAVKTETLMLLQEILNSLEMSSDESNMNEVITDSFQAIGSCLCSFIELQAQFSWSTWKSLSKLSKNFTSESLKHSLSLQWKSIDKTQPSKLLINADLISTIKKHYSQLFCKVGIPKINESLRPSDKEIHASPDQSKRDFQFSKEETSHSHSTNPDSLWASPVWSSKNCSDTPAESDLEEVINLLSCVPVQQFATKLRNKNLISYPVSSDQLSRMIPNDSFTSLSGQLPTQQTWSQNDDVKVDSLYWTLNDSSSSIALNSGLKRSHTYDSPEFYKQWECKEIQMWNASSTETGSSSDDVSSHCLDNEFFPADRHKLFVPSVKRGGNSGESMPGGLENVSEYGEHLLELHTKINTWPLKQPINPEF